jgi:hypothetical protein
MLMGFRHFEAMWRAGVAMDQEAVSLALYIRSTRLYHPDIPDIWVGVPFTRLVQHSRNLVQIRRRFTQGMQQVAKQNKLANPMVFAGEQRLTVKELMTILKNNYRGKFHREDP